MTTFAVPISIFVAWLWMGVVAPSIVRPFGVPMAYGYWRLDRRNQHLSRRQYVWGFGVFAWGMGMLLFIISQSFGERLLSGRSLPSTRGWIIWVAATFVLGWLFGELTAPPR